MNYIESVEIHGFWGTKKVLLKFCEDLNFLIGPNGSGKTTIINLISAALRADIPSLYAIHFQKLTIRLKTIGANKKPVIQVEKTIDEDMGSFQLLYTIREKTTDRGVTYGVKGPYDERIYRDYKYERRYRFREEGAHLTSILSKLVEVNWLSIHRTTLDADKRYQRDEPFESSVDRKLHEISTKFSTYFSALSSRADEESKIFQEQVFLSLLVQKHTGRDIFADASSKSDDKSTFISVLLDLGVSKTKAHKNVNSYFSRLDEAKKKRQSEQRLKIDDAIVLSDSLRIGEFISEWRRLQDKRQDIFRPRSQFESIINELFSGKSVQFSERNTPIVHLENGEDVNINVLSSGEKQLFILLGEAMLQEERPVVFISDEPELSLHVRWQSSLFENVRKLNKSCQIISATHSPDIVGVFQDRIIRVEDFIHDFH